MCPIWHPLNLSLQDCCQISNVKGFQPENKSGKISCLPDGTPSPIECSHAKRPASERLPKSGCAPGEQHGKVLQIVGPCKLLSQGVSHMTAPEFMLARFLLQGATQKKGATALCGADH